MAALTLRTVKGSPLTNSELDSNFTALNTELGQKLVASSNLSDLTNAATARSNLGLGNVENKSSATIRSELTSLNVTTALGFTPYDATNPSGYITSAALSPYLTSATAASTYQTTLVSGTSIKTVNGQSVLGSGNIQIDGGVTSFNTRTGAVTLSSGDVTDALGFTPYNSTNPSGYITSAALSPYITSSTAASTYLPLVGGTMAGDLLLNGAKLAVNTTFLNNYLLRVSGGITGATTRGAVEVNPTAQSDVTSEARGIVSSVSTAASAFTIGQASAFLASQGSIGSGSAITTQVGFLVGSSFTGGAANNYGFRGAIPSGTGRWNLYMDGTAANYLAGSLAIGSSSNTDSNVRVGRSLSGAATMYSFQTNAQFQSGVSTAVGYNSSPQVGDWLALGDLTYFRAQQNTIGSGASITNQTGFLVLPINQGTNVHAFRGQVSGGSGRWNLFMDGTAANFLGGNLIVNAPVGFGASGSPSYGTSGQALLSSGSGAAPTWGTLGVASGGTGATTGDTAIGNLFGRTYLGGPTSGQALYAISGTVIGWGTLPVSGGGTGATSLTANNVILGNGTSAVQTVAPGASGNVLTSNGTTWTSAAPAPSSGSISATASGSINSGKPVVVNADGTVSQAGFAGTPSAGSAYAYQSSALSSFANSQLVAIDPSTGTHLILYSVASGTQTYVVAASVSGDVITYGTPVLVSSSSSQATGVAFDVASSKFLITYSVGNTAYLAVVSVSSLACTIETPVTLSTTYGAAALVYCSGPNKTVISYYSGTYVVLGIVTVTGTTPSVSGQVNTFSVFVNRLLLAYSSVTGQLALGVVWASGGARYFEACVAGISGTTITPGTINVTYLSITQASAYSSVSIGFNQTNGYVFATFVSSSIFRLVTAAVTGNNIGSWNYVISDSTSTPWAAARYDENLETVVLVRSDGLNGTVSNVAFASPTSGSISSAYTFASGAYPISLGFVISPTTKKYTIVFGNFSNQGVGLVFTNVMANLTSENFIGFSAANYNNGQAATIQTAGSLNASQSSLTPGRSYYVQKNGSLSTTPGNPSVFAGTAVSSASILVKG